MAFPWWKSPIEQFYLVSIYFEAPFSSTYRMGIIGMLPARRHTRLLDS